ncbi:MAG TPA: hypothetical protein VFL59_00325 [Candidatus Nanopelagicales bacterium]|nr:hypothetical protein [Candidatus Nanopelagicales bacterium]
MSIINQNRAPEQVSLPGFEGRYDEAAAMAVGFEAYAADQDPAPLFAGLPDDACQCQHWGYVVRGRMTFRYSDGTEETAHAGEAYYARPGHTPLLLAGTEVVEFSPADQLAATMEVVTRNLAAAGTTS